MRVTEPQAIRARILQYAAQPQPDEFNLSLNGSIIGEIEKIIKAIHKGEESTYRHILFGWLFGDEQSLPEPLSSKSLRLTPQMWYGLQKWIGAKAIELGNGKVKWIHRPEFEEELWWVVAHAKCVFDFSGKFDPPVTLGVANDYIRSEFVKENIKGWLEYDRSGIVSAGIQKGGAIVTPIPYEAPLPVQEPEIIPLQANRTVYKAVVEPYKAVVEPYMASVSNVDESEL